MNKFLLTTALFAAFSISTETLTAANAIESASQQIEKREAMPLNITSPVEKPTTLAHEFTTDDIITNPEGTHSYYLHYGDATLGFLGNIQFSDPTGQKIDMVVNGENVYIKHLVASTESLYSAYGGVYVKGTLKDDNTITISFPQVVCYSDYAKYTYVAIGERVEVDTENGITYSYTESENETETEVTLTRDGNGAWHIGESFTAPNWTTGASNWAPEKALCLFSTKTEQWIGDAEWNVTWGPFDSDAKAVEVPEDGDKINLSYYYLNGVNATRQECIVQAVIKDNLMYIPSISNDCTGKYFVGTIDGNKITFKSNQFMTLTSANYVFNFYVGKYEEETVDGKTTYQITPMDEVVMDYNPNTNSITSDDNVVFFINKGNHNYGWSSSCIRANEFSPSFQRFNDMAKTPATPEIVDLRDNSGSGFLMFIANVPNKSEDQGLLLNSKQYFKVYVKPEVSSEPEEYVLTKESYPSLEEYGVESVTEIPYTMQLKNYQLSNYNGTVYLRLYMEMPAAIGIQSIYYGGEDRTATDIVWKYLVDPDGIDTINADQATIVRVYGIDGKLRNGIEPGINIVQMSDGTTKKVFGRE